MEGSVSGRVAGKISLVTGGGTGIGRAVCVRLAEEGAQVVVTSRNPAHVEETCAAVEAACGRRPASAALDVTDRAAVERVVGEVAARFGRIDVLSNNGGIDLPGAPAVTDVTDDEWERIFEINTTGIFRVCRAAVPHMPEGGSIVNMASINSFIAWANDAPYTATKGALLQFTRALALDVAARGIRANSVCPGVIDTPLTDSFLELADDPAALRAEYEAVAPLRRMGTAREVANCVLFLASDEASFVTGSALVVDGGTIATV
jgi:NAD(P)-dependent dehydrogenase (short-subunit alcohol dehydrogenase family)